MDSWGPPQKEHWSVNRRFVLRVEAGKDAYVLSLHQRDGVRLWSIPSPQRSAPIRALVRDDGKYVVLCDCHGGTGYGYVLAFLGPGGKLLRRYTLEEILTQDQVLRAGHSVSSIHWVSHEHFTFLEQGATLGFVGNTLGETFVYSVTTGEPAPLTPTRLQALRSMLVSVARRRLAEATGRPFALWQIGRYHLEELLPKLRRALQTVGEEQTAALGALAVLRPEEAIPLALKLVPKYTQVGQLACLAALESIDKDEFLFTNPPKKVPEAKQILAAWHQLEQHKNKVIHDESLKALCEREEPLYLLAHPELLRHPNEDVRYIYIRNLAERGGKPAIPFLKKALSDAYSVSQVWAFRGLVKYQAPDLLAICKRGTLNPKCGYYAEAQTELAAARDPKATRWLMERVKVVYPYWGDEPYQMIARQRRVEFAPALRIAWKQVGNNTIVTGRAIVGALATLGDAAAREHLFKDLTRGEALDRATSIEFAALVGEPRLLPVVKKCLTDREPWVREAAQKALRLWRKTDKRNVPL
ncbi:hypothetical protein [Armatimonas sp.]|uniref:HEAT repeat domain-containing protein n=1 Tax=Armatimonas sp. TaxID=1872638 RepID=UPI00286B26AA|nr:hypothetical protein [Armatimonas sp.]